MESYPRRSRFFRAFRRAPNRENHRTRNTSFTITVAIIRLSGMKSGPAGYRVIYKVTLHSSGRRRGGEPPVESDAVIDVFPDHLRLKVPAALS
jgi:hypothetical protein